MAILKCLFILGPLLYPCLTSVTLCWAVWMAEHTALSSAVQAVVMGAHHLSFWHLLLFSGS